jgi:hypothetical protein
MVGNFSDGWRQAMLICRQLVLGAAALGVSAPTLAPSSHNTLCCSCGGRPHSPTESRPTPVSTRRAQAPARTSGQRPGRARAAADRTPGEGKSPGVRGRRHSSRPKKDFGQRARAPFAKRARVWRSGSAASRFALDLRPTGSCVMPWATAANSL